MHGQVDEALDFGFKCPWQHAARYYITLRLAFVGSSRCEKTCCILKSKFPRLSWIEPIPPRLCKVSRTGNYRLCFCVKDAVLSSVGRKI